MNMVLVRRDDLRMALMLAEDTIWEPDDEWIAALSRMEAALDAPVYDPATDDHVVSIEFDVEDLDGDEDDPDDPANK